MIQMEKLNTRIETLRKMRHEVMRDLKGMIMGKLPQTEIDKACDYRDRLDMKIRYLRSPLAKHDPEYYLAVEATM